MNEMYSPFYDDKQKNKARQLARIAHPKAPYHCELCNRYLFEPNRHHWAGWYPPHETDIWWVCGPANRRIYEHDGTSKELITKIYKVSVVNQLSFTTINDDEKCGFLLDEQKLYRKICKLLKTWKGQNNPDVIGRPVKCKRWFIQYVNWLTTIDENRIITILKNKSIDDMWEDIYVNDW